jgi:plastocyanin
MKNTTLWVAAIALAGSLQAVFAGDVTGKVTLNGTPPPEIAIDFSANPECGSLVTGQPTTRRYVVGKENGLKDVFVYISKGLEGKKFDAPAEPVVLDQSGCMYQPYVMGVMVGQKLKIKNSDPVMHNLHGHPVVSGNDEFNITQTTQGATTDVMFPKAEVMVKINCDVHKWMLAYVGVCDNPYFAVTDADGHFKIPNLPPGEYTLTAFHQKANAPGPGISQSIKVEADKPVSANFTIDVPVAK